MTHRSTLGLSDNARRAIHVNPARLQPLGENLLIEVLEEEWTLPSGLYIPDTVRPKSCQGIVRAVPLRTRGDVAPGDWVVFEEIQDESWYYDGTEYVLVPESAVLGVVEDGPGYK